MWCAVDTAIREPYISKHTKHYYTHAEHLPPVLRPLSPQLSTQEIMHSTHLTQAARLTKQLIVLITGHIWSGRMPTADEETS
jgi:hypothetical protein